MMDDEHFDGAAANLFKHYNLFPRAIGQILHSFEVEELHLTFTQGRWKYNDWGYPLAPSAGTGVELWAWLNDDRKQTDEHWKGLTNTLSGLFCASLNFIDDTITTEPKLSFRNEGLYNIHNVPANSHNNSTMPRKLRYGSLPHENVCTENLTPWIKLLPCKSKAGVASLLKSHKLFDTRFYSMAVHVRSVCEDEHCRIKSLELVQTITAVFDVARRDGSFDWSISALFEREITQSCPLATTSKIILNLPQTTEIENQYTLTPLPPQGVKVEASGDMKQEVAIYDLKSILTGATPFQLSLHWQGSRPQSVRAVTPGIVAQRYFTGFGQERGGLAIEIRNNNSHDIETVFMDILPWYLKLYLHTFKIQLDGKILDNQRGKSSSLVSKMFYQPAVDRSRPAVLELAMRLPANSLIKFTVSFDKVFLKYTEHRPDANRGFDVGYAVITAQLPPGQGQIGYGGLDHLRIYERRESSLIQSSHNNQEKDHQVMDKVRIYTDTLLVSLPTPDFSMPYNVITMTCTVISLFFGSIFNLLMRSFEVVKPMSPKKRSNGEAATTEKAKESEEKNE
ncbi:hypothetical protein FBU30_008850 [Linnemannia zychae]|nr:hypothetical protein FBU30_008850 [Linnemannia zychae]